MKKHTAKILYLGARGSGKTTNLRSLLPLVKEDHKIAHLSLHEDNSHLFEFLPIHYGIIENIDLTLHIFGFSIDHPLESLRKMIFSSVDAFVFIIDSRVERFIANRVAYEQTRFIFQEEGYSLEGFPQVLQFNKRDEKEIFSSDILSKAFNAYESAEHEAVATKTEGTIETLNLITRKIIDQIIPSYSYSHEINFKKNIKLSEVCT